MSTKLFEAAAESQSILNGDILTTVVRNETDGAEIMEGIEKLSRISDKMIITERVVTAAAQNKSGGHAIVNMLHRCHESQMVNHSWITRDKSSQRVARLLEDVRNDQRSKEPAA